MRKLLTSILAFLLTASILLMAESAVAESIPKPSIPEFTLKYANHPYYKEASNETDLYIGQITINPGKWVDNKTIDVSIKNQQFNNPKYHLFYNVRFKLHLRQNWDEHAPTLWYWNAKGDNLAQYITNAPAQSETEFTQLSFWAQSYPDNSTIDCQIQVLVGYDSTRFVPNIGFAPQLGGHTEPAIAFFSSTNWSPTQTITINKDTLQVTPTANSTQPVTQAGAALGWEQLALILASITGATLTAALLFLHKRKLKVHVK